MIMIIKWLISQQLQRLINFILNMQAVKTESSPEELQSVVKKEEPLAQEPNNFGKWNEEQNFKYMVFLDKNKNRFQCRLKRRKIRLFQQMAEFITSRSSIQCRTHHQKMESKFGDTKAIVQFYKDEVGLTNFKKMVKDFITKGIFQRPYIAPVKEEPILEEPASTIEPPNKSMGIQTDPVPGLEPLHQSLFTAHPPPQVWAPYYY